MSVAQGPNAEKDVESQLAETALALAVVVEALPRTRSLSGLGQIIKRFNDCEVEGPGWFSDALRSLNVRFSVGQRWNSDELKLALQSASVMGLLRLERTKVVLAGPQSLVRLRASEPLTANERRALLRVCGRELSSV